MVQLLKDAGIPAPTDAHVGLPKAQPIASADLLYTGEGLHLAVFLDGGVHDGPVQQKIDASRRNQLRDLGYSVVEIRHDAVEVGIAELRLRLGL